MSRSELDAVMRARMLLLGAQFRFQVGEPDVAEERVLDALAILEPILSRSTAIIRDPGKAPASPAALGLVQPDLLPMSAPAVAAVAV